MEIKGMEEDGAKRCLGGKCDENTTGPSPRSGVTPYQTLAEGPQTGNEGLNRTGEKKHKLSGGSDCRFSLIDRLMPCVF